MERDAKKWEPVFRDHPAPTRNRAQAAAIYDERFCRMWEFHLAVVELEFLHGSHMVFRLLLSTRREAAPITRGFMVDAERAIWAKMAGSITNASFRGRAIDD